MVREQRGHLGHGGRVHVRAGDRPVAGQPGRPLVGEEVGRAAGHAGAGVAADAPEHGDHAAGHVLAAVVAGALDHGRAAELRTAKRSPTRPAAKKRPPVAP